MNLQLENDLQRVMLMIQDGWQMQNNVYDKNSNFIYKMKTLDDCLREIDRLKVDKNYALHRWYNYMTSKYCEEIFCDCGAVKESNIYNHDIDIYINNIPFDVKLTVYPAKLRNRPYDLSTRSGKNCMIGWYYSNQSQESRKQLLNRLYVVCDGRTSHDNMVMKSNFTLMREKIKEYMESVKTDGLNEVSFNENGKAYCLKSDIIRLC